jgi:hypothetical protein
VKAARLGLGRRRDVDHRVAKLGREAGEIGKGAMETLVRRAVRLSGRVGSGVRCDRANISFRCGANISFRCRAKTSFRDGGRFARRLTFVTGGDDADGEADQEEDHDLHQTAHLPWYSSGQRWV